MRILHVVPSYIPAWRYGGPIQSVHGLCKALAALGHRVEVATTNVDGRGDSEVPLGRAVELDGVIVHYFPSRRLRRLYYSPPMRDFMQIGMANWDVVHTHSVFLWPTTAAARIALHFRKPYVVSPRGMLVRDLIARRSPWLKRGWIELFERDNLRHAAAVHVTSPIEGQEIQALGLRTRRIFDIPNGIEMPQPMSGLEALPEFPRRYVLYLGRISWKKGLDRLLSALALAPGIHLVVAGNDDEDYWPKLQRQIVELGLEQRVQRIGFVAGARKQSALSGATLLVLPSYNENFGNVVLEAMAMGKPVVVTPEVGLSSVVSATRSGLVASGGSPQLAAAIIALDSNEALCREMGANGRAIAANYSWNNVARRMEAEYGNITAHG